MSSNNMAVLNEFQVTIENATTLTEYEEFDDQKSRDQNTVTCIQTCLEVGHDEQFQIGLSTLQGFAWIGGANGLIITVDFDEGAKVREMGEGVSDCTSV